MLQDSIVAPTIFICQDTRSQPTEGAARVCYGHEIEGEILGDAGLGCTYVDVGENCRVSYDGRMKASKYQPTCIQPQERDDAGQAVDREGQILEGLWVHEAAGHLFRR